MWELDHKESWVLKNWCFQIVLLQKTLKGPLDSKEIKPVNPKGNQPWLFIGRTDAKALMLWPPDAKSWLTGKDPDAGEDWGQEEKGTTEDEMVWWHHRLTGHKFEQILGHSEGQGSLVCIHGVTKSRTWLSNWTTKRQKANQRLPGAGDRSRCWWQMSIKEFFWGVMEIFWNYDYIVAMAAQLDMLIKIIHISNYN